MAKKAPMAKANGAKARAKGKARAQTTMARQATQRAQCRKGEARANMVKRRQAKAKAKARGKQTVPKDIGKGKADGFLERDGEAKCSRPIL